MPANPPPTVGRTAVNANVMIVLRPRDNTNERYVLVIESPQARARNEPYLEFPKGAFDTSGSFTGPMMDNIRREIGFKLSEYHLINLTALVQEMRPLVCEPGTPTETAVRLFNANPNTTLLLWERFLDRKEVENYRDRRAPNEACNIRMLDYEDLYEGGTRKAELRYGWAMYELLHSYGILQQRLYEKRIGR